MMSMDDTWSRSQVLPSLFKSEPAQIALRPLLAPGRQRSPLLQAQTDVHYQQRQQQFQQSYQYQHPHQHQQQSHAPLPRSTSALYSHQSHQHYAHQHDAVPIKTEPDTASSYDHRQYPHAHQYSHFQPQQHQRTSLPVLADMLRGARPAAAARPQCEMTTPVATPPAGADTTPKSALSFILGEAHARTATTTTPTEFEAQEMYRASASSASSFMSEDDELSATSYAEQYQYDASGLPQSAAQHARESKLARLKVASKRRAARPASRTCKFDGCDQYVVDHGLCVRHGGGKRCLTDGCTSRAKHFGRCWRHGGSMECKITDCVNRAKSRGFCWSHGGGTKCKAEPCEKIAISNGLCWAHGGGKRCVVDGCMKQAYERTQNYCNSHFQQWKQSGEPALP